jgi:radical SAM superfamily enzyme YgiQ (UPF0313 family)
MDATFVEGGHLPTDAAKTETFTAKAAGPVRKRAVLLNPPGSKKYFRDYFCTLVSKASYYYHPVDLIYLSGVLDKAGYFLDCVDAIAEGLSQEETWKRVEVFKPELVVYLIASPSYEEDVPFLTELKKRLPETTFVGSGDVYREIRAHALDLHPFCDAVLTDFSTQDFPNWLARTEDSVFDNLIYRGKDGQVKEGAEKHGHGFYAMPVPRWDLWPIDKYIFPFSEQRMWATVLTDFGCPFSCTFCPMSTTGYKLRDIDTVIDELRLLRSLGIHEVFFRDQTFGVNRVRTQELLRRIKEEFPELRWTCWSRVDLVNEEFLKAVKDAGCHTIMFGIESANEDILKKYKKNTKQSQMIEALNTTRKLGLKSVGTFVIGLPGESEQSIKDTIEFATKLSLDYASFNIATPRFGSTFRRLMREQGALDTTRMTFDSSQSKPAWLEEAEDDILPNEVIFRLQSMAIKRFYLRPGFLLRRALTLKTPYQAWAHVREAFDLLRSR